MVRFEVVAPEDADFVLRDLGMLFLRRDVPRELVRVFLALLRRRACARLLELVDQVDHADDRVGRHLRVMRVVDAARDVAVRVRNRGG